jgi:hypothetical protein
VVDLGGRRVEDTLPGANGRLLFAYLVLNRLRRMDRDELLRAVYGEDAPPDHHPRLSVLLSKLRHAVGPELLPGRSEIELVLPQDAFVDVEAAFVADALHRLVLDRHGMRHAALQPEEPAPPGIARGYDPIGPPAPPPGRYVPFRSAATAEWTAAGVVATAPDLATWGRALFAGRVVDQRGLREMLHVVSTGDATYYALLAFYALPREHWSKLRSTNPLERVNREIGRRIDVVGIFPNDAALIRLAGALLIEKNDEWLVSRRYLSQESLSAVLDPAEHTHEKDRGGPRPQRRLRDQRLTDDLALHHEPRLDAHPGLVERSPVHVAGRGECSSPPQRSRPRPCRRPRSARRCSTARCALSWHSRASESPSPPTAGNGRSCPRTRR